MRKVFTILIALMLSFTWASAQRNVGKIAYSQMGSIVDYSTGYISSRGTGIQPASSKSADDFVVPAEGMTLTGVSALFNRAPAGFVSMASNGFDIYIHADNSGIPGAVINNFNIPIAQVNSYQLDYEVYQYDFIFPSEEVLVEGKYWISIIGINEYGGGSWLTNNNNTTIEGTYQAKQYGMAGMGTLYMNAWSNKNDAGNKNGLYKNLNFALIGVPASDDLCMKTLESPLEGTLTATEQIKVKIQNTGINTQTDFMISYEITATINNVLTVIAQDVDTITGASLVQNAFYSYTFPITADLSGINTYIVKTKVILTGDTYSTNDEAIVTVKNYGTQYRMGSITKVTACEGHFVDDGGINSPYTAASYDTMEFTPGIAGNKIILDFSLVDIFNNDYASFTFYDGDLTNISGGVINAPKLHEYTNAVKALWIGEIKARNPKGTMLVLSKYRNTPSSNNRGWIAEIKCQDPGAVDFMMLTQTIGTVGQWFLPGSPVNIDFTYTSRGKDTTAREVYLLIDGVVVDSKMTSILVPGQIGSSTFSWTPSVAKRSVSIQVKIQDDTQASNGDNFLEKKVVVMNATDLMESFEIASPVIPFDWISKKNTVFTSGVAANITHGTKAITLGLDTLLMPLMKAEVGSTLDFSAVPPTTNGFKIIKSLTLNGPWTDVSAVFPRTSTTAVEYSVDLSAHSDTAYYFAFANTITGGGNAAIDYVRGTTLYKYPQDLKIISWSYPETVINANQDFEFSVVLNNVGNQKVLGSNYAVQIRTVDSVYATIQGTDINVGANGTIIVPAKFATATSLNLYPKIVVNNEVRVDNNALPAVSFKVTGDYTYAGPIVGNGSSSIIGTGKNTFQQSILYPSDVKLYGNIKGIEIMYKNGSATVPVADVPIRIYMAEMTDSAFRFPVTTPPTTATHYRPIRVDTVPIPGTLVYSGTVTFAANTSGVAIPMYFPFSAPYAYNGTKNLLITIFKDNKQYTGSITINTTTLVNVPAKVRTIYGQDVRAASIKNNENNIVNTNASSVIQKGAFNLSAMPQFRFVMDNPVLPVFESSPVLTTNERGAYTYNADIKYTGIKPYSMTATGAPGLSVAKVNDTLFNVSIASSTYGEYPIKLTATDGSYTAVQRFNLSVRAVPLFTSNPVTQAVINKKYTYTAQVTNHNTGSVVFTGDAGNPSWLTVTDNENNTATISGIPNALGIVTVKVIATGAYGDPQVQTYLLDVSTGPSFLDIVDQFVNEGTNVDQIVSLQYDGVETVTVSSSPSLMQAGLTLTQFTQVSSTITGTAVMGVYPVTLYATNGIRSDSASYTLTVYDTPEFTSTPATLNALINQEYSYNAVVANLGAGYTHITGDATNPTWLTVTDNGDKTAKVSGIPTVAGNYTIKLIATGQGGAVGQQTFTLVVGAKPKFPFPATVYINEKELYVDTIAVNYAGVKPLTISVGSTKPDWMAFTDLTNGTYKLNGTPPAKGEYPIQLIVTDGLYGDTTNYNFAVYATPVITSTPVLKGVKSKLYKYDITATNAGIGKTKLSGGTGNPSWLTVYDNGDNTANAVGYPTAIGDFTITVIATGDGGLTNVQTYTLTVGAGPDFLTINDQTANEGTPFSQTVSYDYVGNGTPLVSKGASFPSWLTLTNNTNKTATLTGNPVVGVHQVQLIVTDGFNADTADYKITVYALPKFESTPDDLTILVNEVFNYTAVVSNSGIGTTTITGKVGNPAWVSVTDNGNNTAKVTGTPTAAGNYIITLIATGEKGAKTEQTFTVSVGSVPVFETLSNVILNENDAYTSTVTVKYEGLGTVVISKGANFPAWLSLTDNGNKTATIAGTAVVGAYTVELIVSDGTYNSTSSYLITVKTLPVFTSTPVTYDVIGNDYTYTAAVTLADGFATFTGNSNPSWITVTNNGNNTATVKGTATEKGDYTITLVATNATGGSVEQVYILTIGEGPTFNAISDELIKEGADYSKTASIIYDGIATPVISAGANMPAWLTVVDNGDNTATISGDNAATGVYTVELVVTDGINSDAISYVLTVGAVPVFTSTPVTTGIVGELYTYSVTVAYSGSDVLAITTEEMPTWMTLVDNGDKTATLSGTPIASGFFPVSIKATGEYNSVLQVFDIEFVVGVNENEALNYVVYPNPTSSYFTVSNSENTTIEVVDLGGNVVKFEKITAANQKIDVSMLSQGVYMIVITNNTGKVSQRLVIE